MIGMMTRAATMDPVMTIHRNECREADIAPPGPVARVSIYDGAVAAC